jgi:putative addiction module CopG family antidote
MTITLPPSLAAFVGFAVRSGRYPSELEVLHQALRLLSDRDLGALVQAGIDSADRANFATPRQYSPTSRRNCWRRRRNEKPIRLDRSRTGRYYNWVADAVDAIDMEHAVDARQTLADLTERLKELAAYSPADTPPIRDEPSDQARKDPSAVNESELSHPAVGDPEP